ncbi:MAG TPA: Ig-like domain repeat protein, partial [Terriglobales bacterium]|nr:Ig-like domain repeat protein [Terriglobales bacterium]
GTVGWPTCGEQDIMEWVPQYTPTTTSSTIHGPGYSGANGIGSKFTFPSGGRVDDAGYHTYGVIWSQNKMQFYRDDYTTPFFTVTPANIPGGTTWVYNHPFYILLNFAVGGNFPGNPNGTTPSPANVLVDYVRVYEQTPTITLASSANPSVFGQPVTFTATLSPASATGTVQFQDGSTNLGAAVTVSGGTATSLPVSSLAVGSHSITAVYSGDSSFAAGTSSPLAQTVNQASSTTTVSSSANPSVFGQSVTFTATVTAVAPGSGTPTGTVTFKDGGSTIGTGTLSSGVATMAISTLVIGNHTITAAYGGDTNFSGSSSGTLTQTVNQASSTTTVSSSANPSVFGQSVTFTATVSAVAPGAGSPSGAVQFQDGGSNLGSAVTLSAGTATLGTSLLSVGTHNITAVYLGDANFNGSTSPSLAQTVNQDASSTSVSSSVNPSSFGQIVTFTATVSAALPGSGTPTGMVQFKDGASNLGAPAILNSGAATSSAISSLTVGSHSITAVYSGDSNFSGSTSPALTQTVTSGPTTATTTTINIVLYPPPTPGEQPGTVHMGQSITVTATVSTAAAGSPTGSVTLFDEHGAQIGPSLNLAGSGATQNVTFPPFEFGLGAHTITAKYSGDGIFLPSSSSPSQLNHTPRPR